jgi:hypothetical protein
MSNLVYLAEARFPDGRTLSKLLEVPVTESYSRTKECWKTVCERLGAQAESLICLTFWQSAEMILFRESKPLKRKTNNFGELTFSRGAAVLHDG